MSPQANSVQSSYNHEKLSCWEADKLLSQSFMLMEITRLWWLHVLLRTEKVFPESFKMRILWDKKVFVMNSNESSQRGKSFSRPKLKASNVKLSSHYGNSHFRIRKNDKVFQFHIAFDGKRFNFSLRARRLLASSHRKSWNSWSGRCEAKQICKCSAKLSWWVGLKCYSTTT